MKESLISKNEEKREGNLFEYQRPLNPLKDRLICIEREREFSEVIGYIRQGRYIALLGPDRIGKTTFILQMMERLKDKYEPIYIDLKESVRLSKKEIFQHIVQTIDNQLRKGRLRLGFTGAKMITTGHLFKHFLINSIVPKTESALIFFFDGINAISEEIAMELLVSLRSLYIDSSRDQRLKTISVLVSGTVNLLELTVSQKAEISPFNIAQNILIEEFKRDEVERFVKGSFKSINIYCSERLIERLYGETRGDPYLLQKICYKLLDRLQKKEGDREGIKKYGAPQQIKRIIEEEELNECLREIISEDGSIILDRAIEATKEKEIASFLENLLYGKGEIGLSSLVPGLKRLDVAGVVRKEEGRYIIRNPIYAEIFKGYFTQSYFGESHLKKGEWKEAIDCFGDYLKGMENPKLRSEAESYHLKAGMLEKISDSILHNLDLQGILKITLEGVAKCFGYEMGLLYLVNKKKNLLECCQQINLGKIDIPLDSSSIIVKAAKEKKSLFIEHLEKENPDLGNIHLSRGSFIAVPLIGGKRDVVGIIVLASLLTKSHKDLDFISPFADYAALAIQNARVHKRLRTLNEVSRKISSDTDLEKVLDLIIDRALEVIEALRASLYLIESDGLIMVRCKGWKDEGRFRLSIGEGVVGKVVEEGKPLNIPDVENDERYKSYREVFDDTRSELAVPLKSEGRVLGVLCIDGLSTNAFDKEDEELLFTFADLSASAIHKAQHLQDLMLLSSIETAQPLTDLESFFNPMVKMATERLKTDICSFFLYDKESKKFILRASTGFPEEDIGKIGYQRGEGLTGFVAEKKTPILVNDVRKDPHWKHKYSEKKGDIVPSEEEEIRAFLGVPVMNREKEVIGLFTSTKKRFSEKDQNIFTKSDLRLITILAVQVSVAIENIELIKEREENLKRLAEKEKEAELGEITAGLGHELAKILPPLNGAIKRGNKESAEKMMQRLSRIGEEMRRYRKTMGEFRFSSCIIGNLLKDVMALYGSVIKENEIKIIDNLSNKEMGLNIDQNMMQLVFSNLLSNAIDAIRIKGEKKGEITIDLAVDESMGIIQVSFKDNGCGIREYDREDIFKEWASSKQEGTGLGLPLAKRIVEKHRGRLYLSETEYGEGSRFVVELPIKQEEMK
ncbi:MAG: GAF domain-containing protein [bacterium]